MAKEFIFTVEEPVSEALAVRWWEFLIAATAKREKVSVTGSVQKINKEDAS